MMFQRHFDVLDRPWTLHSSNDSTFQEVLLSSFKLRSSFKGSSICICWTLFRRRFRVWPFRGPQIKLTIFIFYPFRLKAAFCSNSWTKFTWWSVRCTIQCNVQLASSVTYNSKRPVVWIIGCYQLDIIILSIWPVCFPVDSSGWCQSNLTWYKFNRTPVCRVIWLNDIEAIWLSQYTECHYQAISLASAGSWSEWSRCRRLLKILTVRILRRICEWLEPWLAN